MPGEMAQKFRFRIVKGIFLQSEDTTNADTFNFIARDFGLIVSPARGDAHLATPAQVSSWSQVAPLVKRLNAEAPKGTCYKLIFAGRHGQGYHNVALEKYGREAWDEHWSRADGDADSSWVDAHLTELGIQQAKDASALWRKLIPQGIPAPQAYYVSPHDRTLATARHTFSSLKDILAAHGHAPYDPLVTEKLRETYGDHTCDRRSSRTYIEKTYPEARIEDGFVENDPYWTADHRETNEEMDVRFSELLWDIFSTDKREILSFTSHSGAISSLLRVIGHRPFALPTGAVIAFIVRAEAA